MRKNYGQSLEIFWIPILVEFQFDVESLAYLYLPKLSKPPSTLALI